MFAWYAWRQFCEQYGEDNVEREREIPWPLGVGHCDLYVKTEKLLVEVKSSTSPQSLIDSAIQQVRMYLRFDPEAEHAALYVIDPVDLDREDFLAVKLGEEDAEQIDALVREVALAIDGQELPACSQDSPSACRFSGCGFTDVAWQDWQPPEPTQKDDPELVQAALEWHKQREYRRELEQGVDAAKIVETELHDKLIEAGLPEGDSVLGGRIRMKRTKVAGRVTARIADARKAGVWTAELDAMLGDYIRIGQPHERLTSTLLEAS
jgi:hypothetical protein